MAHLARIITSLLFITSLGSIVVCFTPTVRFGNNAVLNRIVEQWGISFQTCIDNCLARTRCNSLIYFPRLHRCKLGSNVIADTDVTTNPSRVLVTGFEDYHKTEYVCGDRVCELTETCTEKGPDNYQCEVTECSRIKKAMIEEENILGNVFTIGSKRKVDKLGVVTTCSASGIWTIKKTGTERIITGTRDCLNRASFTSDEIPFPQDGQVLCDVTTEGGNWVIFQRRFDGSENFYRGWNDYVNGFGELTGEFWLGLDKLSSILAYDNAPLGFELRVDLENFEGEKRYAKYSTFHINDASDMYRLTVRGYTGDAGESLIAHDDMRFTTYDRDHDTKEDVNCAVQSHGAYWYGHCHASNLNGLYYHGAGNTGNYAINVGWVTWTGHYRSLKKTEMKIRRNSDLQ